MDIAFYTDYEELGRPDRAGTYLCRSRSVSIEIDESTFDIWAESAFTAPLPISVIREPGNGKIRKYMADVPEITPLIGLKIDSACVHLSCHFEDLDRGAGRTLAAAGSSFPL